MTDPKKIDPATEKMLRAFDAGFVAASSGKVSFLKSRKQFLATLAAETPIKPQSISATLLQETHLRREALCRMMPWCPMCHEAHQIQLVEWLGSDAKWKCRICKHAWTFEPTLKAEPPTPIQPGELAVRIAEASLEWMWETKWMWETTNDGRSAWKAELTKIIQPLLPAPTTHAYLVGKIGEITEESGLSSVDQLEAIHELVSDGSKTPEQAASAAGVSDGVALIAAERQRQISKGFNAKHDDMHDDGIIAEVVEQLIHRVVEPRSQPLSIGPSNNANDLDQWHLHILNKWGGDPLRLLIICGALIAAEIDRLNRAAGVNK